ncbi:c-type cytochrome [Steroidobacter sp. S1-65]|uniref:C-type cytochrome n=1 Tax=Steroidobacter gossypii TaxID=2805490 RepID=A0ABS1X0T1_9GAMM|nr:c-type cytochrome [Steroidobacter gossypii]MBM0106861.1 c-type cytochrome [Steroidobacter gossypii]
MRSIRSWLLICALPLTLSACSSGGDATRGRELYAKECAACHSLAANTDAPLHCGLMGRKAGTVPGFPYSEAMRSSGLVWDEKTLDEFLAAPFVFLPGTLMGFPGFADAADRADVIAYLREASTDRSQCSK